MATSTSTQWPEYVCKNSCGFRPIKPEEVHKKCPKCKGPLVRWKRYQVK